MPKFHLHLWESGRLFADDEGTDLSDGSAAILQAKRTLGEMLCDDIAHDREAAARCIVIADENGSTLGEIAAPQVAITENRAHEHS